MTRRADTDRPSVIYALFKGRRCVYIGCSKDFRARVRQHRYKADIEFDDARILAGPFEREHAERVEARAIYLLQPEFNKAHTADVDHGTTTGYNRGCRCNECTRASSTFQNDRQRRRKGALAPNDPRHGIYTTYTNWRCRCEPCKSAMKEWLSAHRAKRAGAA